MQRIMNEHELVSAAIRGCERLIERSIIDQFEITRRGENQFSVDVPFAYPDGDYCRVFVSRNNDGTWRVSDNGSSLGRVVVQSPGTLDCGPLQRAREIAAYHGLAEVNGEIVLEATNDIGGVVFAVAQASIEIVTNQKGSES